MRQLAILSFVAGLLLVGSSFQPSSAQASGFSYGHSKVVGATYGIHFISHSGWPVTFIHLASGRSSGHGHKSYRSHRRHGGHTYYRSHRPYNGHHYNRRDGYRSGGYRGKYGGGHVYQPYRPYSGGKSFDRSYRGYGYRGGHDDRSKSLHRRGSHGGTSFGSRGGHGGCRGRC